MMSSPPPEPVLHIAYNQTRDDLMRRGAWYVAKGFDRIFAYVDLNTNTSSFPQIILVTWNNTTYRIPIQVIQQPKPSTF